MLFDRKSQTIVAQVVSHKGTDLNMYTGSAIKRDIEASAYRRIVIKCDQESLIKAVMEEAQNGCASVEVL